MHASKPASRLSKWSVSSYLRDTLINVFAVGCNCQLTDRDEKNTQDRRVMWSPHGGSMHNQCLADRILLPHEEEGKFFHTQTHVTLQQQRWFRFGLLELVKYD